MTGIYTSPFGQLLLETRGDLICRCKWLPAGSSRDIPASRGDDSGFFDEVCRSLDEYFSGRGREFNFKLATTGTPFREKVWNYLSTIPYGRTMTYGEIAAALGCHGGARAVAGACAANSICIFIPCHRVVAAGGKIGGYSAFPGKGSSTNGLAIKQKLLSLESAASLCSP